MSKHSNTETQLRLGGWLRQLRMNSALPLRVVATAAGMDLAHLHKIELGQRLPTEAQTAKLAGFFKLDETEAQARRIAEKVRDDFKGPAAQEAISLLAKEIGQGEKKGDPTRPAETTANPKQRKASP